MVWEPDSGDAWLSEDEKAVINIMEQETGLDFNEIQRRTKIPCDRLSEIIDKFTELGMIVETKAKSILHVENESGATIVAVYDKKALQSSENEN